MNEPTIPAKVALQGNRITLAASEYINEENISNKDFQLLNEQGKVLEIDRIKVSANEIEIFPKERILKDSGEKFTINYLGENSILKEQFNNKDFKNTSMAKPLSIEELRLSAKNNQGLVRDVGGILNFVDLEKDNTIYYTTNTSYIDKNFKNVKTNNFDGVLKNGKELEKIEKEQANNIHTAMQYISKVSNIKFIHTDDPNIAHLGFVNAELNKGMAVQLNEIYLDGKDFTKIPQDSKEKFTSIDNKSLIVFDNNRFNSINKQNNPEEIGFQLMLHEIGHFLGLDDVFHKKDLKDLTTTQTLMSYKMRDADNGSPVDYKNLELYKFFDKYRPIDLKVIKSMYGEDGLNAKYGINYDNTLKDMLAQLDVSKHLLDKNISLIANKTINIDEKQINQLFENEIQKNINLNSDVLKQNIQKFTAFKQSPFEAKLNIMKNFNIDLNEINEKNIDKKYKEILSQELVEVNQIKNEKAAKLNQLLNSPLNEEKIIQSIKLLEKQENKNINLTNQLVKIACEQKIDKNLFNTEIQAIYDDFSQTNSQNSNSLNQKLSIKLDKIQNNVDTVLANSISNTLNTETTKSQIQINNPKM